MRPAKPPVDRDPLALARQVGSIPTITAGLVHGMNLGTAVEALALPDPTPRPIGFRTDVRGGPGEDSAGPRVL